MSARFTFEKANAGKPILACPAATSCSIGEDKRDDL